MPYNRTLLSFYVFVCYTFVLWVYYESHSCSVSDSSFQNSSAACSVPYKAFFSCTYSMGLPCLLHHICFLYIVGSSFMINSATVPSSSMCMLSSMSACRKAPGMSDTTMYLFSFASIAHNSIIASIDMVGELVSSLFVYILCGLPSAHPLAFIVPSLFFFKEH